jgi:hypothetical protein
MSLFPFITAFQKLRIFLTTLFPVLGRMTAPIRSAWHRIIRDPRVTRAVGRVRGSRLGLTTESWVRRSYARDYSRFQVDTNKLPKEAVTMLRRFLLMGAESLREPPE